MNSSTPSLPPKSEGEQPLDALMIRLALKNQDLVRASSEQLTHKMVQKGRKGRPLTRRIQEKILRALNSAQEKGQFTLADLFSYQGR